MRFFVFFLAVLPLAGQNAEALLAEGLAHFQNGRYPAAIESFREVLKLSPADARAIGYLGVTRAMLGDCLHTVNELGLQARRNPDLALRRLAGLATVRCLSARNDFVGALPYLSDLLIQNPNDPDVIYESAQFFNR